MKPVLLDIENLTVHARGDANEHAILDSVNLSIREGETLAIVGASGSGKSTLALSVLRLLAQSFRYVRGAIRFKNTDLLRVPEKDVRALRGTEISFIPQDPISALTPAVRIEAQFREILWHRKLLKGEAAGDAMNLWMRRVGLGDIERVRRAYPAELSGGMCQRVLMAMAFSCQPALLFSDEATSMLDSSSGRGIFELLKTLCGEQRVTHCLITHDMDHALRYADRIAVMENGRIVESFRPTEEQPAHPSSLRLLNARAENRRIARGRRADDRLQAEPIINLKDVSLSYPLKSRWLRRTVGQLDVVRELGFKIHRGEMVALVGPSGSGKTTIARAIAGLIGIQRGHIEFQGASIRASDRAGLRKQRQKLQLVVQDTGSAFDPRLTIGESLAEGMLIHRIAGSHKEARPLLTKLLDEAGLPPEFLDRFPAECSGGERQRLNLVRALAVKPELLVCDEPTSALDSVTSVELMELIDRLRVAHSLAVLLISHDERLVAAYANAVIRIGHQGRDSSL